MKLLITDYSQNTNQGLFCVKKEKKSIWQYVFGKKEKKIYKIWEKLIVVILSEFNHLDLYCEIEEENFILSNYTSVSHQNINFSEEFIEKSENHYFFRINDISMLSYLIEDCYHLGLQFFFIDNKGNNKNIWKILKPFLYEKDDVICRLQKEGLKIAVDFSFPSGSQSRIHIDEIMKNKMLDILVKFCE